MISSTFNIYSKSQTVEVNPTEISGAFDGLNSFLNIFIHFTYRFPREDLSMDIISVSANLKLQESNIQLSEVAVPIGLSVFNSEYKRGEWFRFLLNEKSIKAIENNRKGDPSFQVELTVLFSTYIKTEIVGQIINIHDCLNKDKTDLNFKIPKSIWVENIFPKLGYHSLKLVEIPLNHKIINEAYADIIFEFNQAEEYYNKQDFNKCVAHCRNVLDALHRNLIKIKKGVDSETAFKWLKNIDKSTLTWIDDIDKANSSLTSKSHHSGQKEKFTRQQAEAIYLVVLGLINFVGHIK